MTEVINNLNKWADELIDLSRRNKLVYFKHTKLGSLGFQQPATVIDPKLTKGQEWGFYLPPPPPSDPDIPYKPAAPGRTQLIVDMNPPRYGPEIKRALQNLSKKSRVTLLDSGLWVLYLGLGMLKWEETDGRTVSSPLLLTPVQLSSSFKLSASDEGESAVNPALAVKLEKDYGIVIPSLEDLPKPQQTAEGVIEAVKQVTDNIPDGGLTLQNVRVTDEAILTSFTFHKEVIFRDMKENIESIAEHSVVRLISQGASGSGQGESYNFAEIKDKQLSEEYPPEDTVCILDADATQRKCLISASQGHSFVMDGPPGTGKSQTIVNLIAQLISDGKSVLFVSEKAAALEVVHNRLLERQLSPFVLELHSHKASRKEVAKELYAALDERVETQSRFGQVKQEALLSNRKQLTGYAEAVNEERQPLGMSLHDAIGQISQSSELEYLPDADMDARSLDASGYAKLGDTADTLGNNWGPVTRGDSFVWKHLKDSSGGRGRQSELKVLADQCKNKFDSLQEVTSVTCDELKVCADSPDDVPWVAGLINILSRKKPVGAAWLCSERPQDITDTVGKIQGLLAERKVIADQLDETYRKWDTIPEESITQFGARSDDLHTKWRDMQVDGIPYQDMTLGYLKQGDAFTLFRTINELSGTANKLGTMLCPDRMPNNLKDTERLISLAELHDSSTPPDTDWFGEKPQTLRTAVQNLDESYNAFTSSRDRLSGLFTEDALQLDLPTLRVRIESNQGLRKFGSVYKNAKNLLTEVTVAGRVTKQVLKSLPAAVEWQDNYKLLCFAEEQHSATVGSYYWTGRDTVKMGKLRNALHVTEQIQHLASGRVPVNTLRKYFGHDSDQSPELYNLTEEGTQSLALLREMLESLNISYEKVAGVDFPTLKNMLSDITSVLDNQTADLESFSRMVSGSISEDTISLSFADQFINRVVEHSNMTQSVVNAGEGIASSLGQVDWFDSNILTEATGWVQEILPYVNRPISADTADALLAYSGTVDLETPYQNFTQATTQLVDMFQPDYRKTVKSKLLSDSFIQSEHLLHMFCDTVADINEWGEYLRNRRALKDAGLGKTVDMITARKLESSQVGVAVRRSILTRWVDQIIESERDVLEPLRGVARDGIQHKYQELDREHITESVADVINRCGKYRPVESIGGAEIIKREANKKTRHIQVRQLLQQAGPVILKYKPCFMMSPLSISQFLPSDFMFDAVIFDEASQIRTSDAICAISRGKQLIVAGDDKQLPPTNYFQYITDSDDGDDSGIQDFESLLTVCKGKGMKSLPLLWHYRSRHESLIEFSNRSFYDSKLFTFPGAVHTAPDLGLELFKVDGTYSRGGSRDNKTEAEFVIDRILENRKAHPEQTIGVVALSSAQQNTIEIMLEKRADDEPLLQDISDENRLDGLFVKNLENVQGDERDIIIISICYGPDYTTGKLHTNFGPLNNDGGERRLNVAITRARRRVEIVCSFEPSRLRSQTKNSRIRLLAQYLEYAQKGKQAFLTDDDQTTDRTPDSPFEEEVIRTVRNLGYTPVPQVGVSGYRIDIGVQHPDRPGEYVLGIECDGASYHSSKDARSRDRTRQQVLEGLGWQIHRIWSTAWFTDRQQEETRLKQVIQLALHQTYKQTHKQPGKSARPLNLTVTRMSDKKEPPAPGWVTEYKQPAINKVHHPKSALYSPYHRGLITGQIHQVVNQHGTIHKETVFQVVSKAWGYQQVSKRGRETLNYITGKMVKKRKLSVTSNGFMTIPGKVTSVIPVRVPLAGQKSDRTMEQIPFVEVGSAVCQLVKDAGGQAQYEPLIRRVANLYGFNRLTDKVKQPIEATISDLVKEGELEHSDSRLVIKESNTST